MGTSAQARGLIAALNAVRKIQGQHSLTTDEGNKVAAWVLDPARTLNQIRGEFSKLNAITGFDRNSSQATTAQRTRISQLEVGVYGARRTTHSVSLTFEEAHDLIDRLASMRRASVDAVRSLENLANDHSSVRR